MIKIHVARNRIQAKQPAIVVEQNGKVEFTDNLEILDAHGTSVGRLVQDKRGMNGRHGIQVWVEVDTEVVYAPDTD